MHRSCGRVECSWVNKHESTFACGDHGEFRKANIVAYRQSNLAIFWKINYRDFVPRRQDFTLNELDLAWYIDVEKMRLTMCSYELASWGEDKRCVIVFLRLWNEFWYASSDEICLSLCGYR